MGYSLLAAALNDELLKSECCVFSMLSKKGKAIYFPSKGILGQSAQAKGKKINATIGTAFEEDGSPLTTEVMKKLVNFSDSSFLYAPSQGNPNIRQEWKKQIFSKNSSLKDKNISLPITTNALTHGLWVSGFLFVDEGDEIVLPDLYWDNYDLLFTEGFNARIKTHNSFKDGGYDVDSFEKALAEVESDKKIVLLNFPNNPTGYTVTEDEAAKIVQVLLKSANEGNKIVAILDDAYFGLVYEKGILKESIFALLADLHPNILAVKLDGPTKEDFCWGLRVGFITFAFKGATCEQLSALEAKAAGTVRGSISNVSAISQEMLLNAYKSEFYDEQKLQKIHTLLKRYEKIRQIFKEHPEFAESFEAMPFNSGYFMCLKLKGVDPEKVREVLLCEYDTGVIVLSGLIRIAFSSVALDLLETLFMNIHKAVLGLKK